MIPSKKKTALHTDLGCVRELMEKVMVHAGVCLVDHRTANMVGKEASA
jgi:hypothetical protein